MDQRLYSQKYTFPRHYHSTILGELQHVQPQHGVYYLRLFIFCGIALLPLRFKSVEVARFHRRSINEDLYTSRSESPAVSNNADLIYIKISAHKE